VFHADETFVSVFEGAYVEAFRDLFYDERSRHNFCNGLEENMGKYEQNFDSNHFRDLRHYRSHWNSIEPRKLCFACCLDSCQFFLPCGHAVCELCYLGLKASVGETEAKISGKTTGDQCPFCLRVLGFWEPFSPSRAADDDQAQKMKSSEDFTIGAVIYKYHDLVMTAIDIGLKLKKWGLSSWTQNITSALLTVLHKPECWLDLKGGWANTWRNLIGVVGQKCPHQRDVLRGALRQAFEIDILQKDSRLNHKLDSSAATMAWHLLASFFSFEFVCRPRRSRGSLVCVGRLRCQQSDHYLFQYLIKGMENQVRVCVDAIWVPFHWPCVVKFRLPNLFQPFDVRIAYGELMASITGYPANAYKVLEASTIMGNGSAPGKHKRRQGEYSGDDYVKRLRIRK